MNDIKDIKNVAVLCGGDGREREVSLRSGEAVCKALNEAGFNAQTLDLHSLSEVDRVKDFDAAFIAMHGDWGEDGRLQSELGKMGIHYTGSGPRASSLAMDKWKSLALFKKTGIRTPESLLMPVSYDEIIASLGSDVVVKPCSGGSTVGVTIIKGLTPEKLSQAVELAKESYESDVMIEKYIAGREITCAVWEHEGQAEALPVIEIVPHSGFYDYKNKYTSGATEYITPAKIDDSAREQISEMAVKAHKVLGCRAYSRSDFRLTQDNTAYILEVNTAPGMTATSLVPKAARAAGIDFPEFLTHILRCK